MPARLALARRALEEADFVAVGGGAGLSAAAGLTYGGERFWRHFADYAQKYGIRDMYEGMFYPFSTPEELWAHHARHIAVNRFLPALPLYRKLYALVAGKDHFVITTNVDGQFQKAGFRPDRIFAVQGDYGLLQCARGCHERLYGNEELVREMTARTEDFRVPAELVPRCPVCGGAMAVHVRTDAYFVQDEAWYESEARWEDFLARAERKRTVLLELGVGFNTPGIVRFPFEALARSRPDTTLLRVNRDYPQTNAGERAISFDEDMEEVLSGLC